MFEIMLLSLFTGSLGLQALMTAQWQRWQQHQLALEQEEEEILTLYQSKDDPVPTEDQQTSKTDLRSLGWEFKILRAQSRLFENPKVLKQVCDEEAEAGWILLEKLDEQRLRFKRPICLREQPTQSKYDPYRCSYGSKYSWSTLGSLLILALTIALPAYLGYTLVTITLNQKQTQPGIPNQQLPNQQVPNQESPSQGIPSQGLPSEALPSQDLPGQTESPLAFPTP
jgi:hypothetical protein